MRFWYLSHGRAAKAQARLLYVQSSQINEPAVCEILVIIAFESSLG